MNNDDILEKALEMMVPLDGMNGADGMMAATYAAAFLIHDVAEENEYDGLLEEFTTCLKMVLNEILKRKTEKTIDDTRRLRHHEEAMGDHRHGSFQCGGKTQCGKAAATQVQDL